MERQVSKWRGRNIHTHILTFILLVTSIAAQAQVKKGNEVYVDYDNPRRYVVKMIQVTGLEAYDRNVLIIQSGLYRGQRIKVPGPEITKAITRIWSIGKFADVEIYAAGYYKDSVVLNINVKELPRLSRFSIRGLNKNETKNVREEVSLKRNMYINEQLIRKTRREIKEYFYEKGFFDCAVEIKQEADTMGKNTNLLRINIDRGKRVKVQDIIIVGNDNVKDSKIRQLIKPKRLKYKLNVFASSKLIQTEFDEEKKKIAAHYQSLGFRDAKLVSDTIIRAEKNKVILKLTVDEGSKYHFRNITWLGNTKYRDGQLDTILDIKKGDVFNQEKLDTRLFMNPNGFDVSSLYMDDGYLFFNLNPVEVSVEDDSIDIEIRIYEGKQATINKVTVIGNDKTSDFVILRALRTKPGQKFSRTDIQRSMRELAALNYFDPEALDVNPIPNPASGTVDIEYKVVEKPSDQIEASGGFGGGFGFVGSVGLSLNNFSTRKMFNGDWNPIPSGDGQRLTLRAQSNGLGFQAYNFSFTEPWLGGKKPNSLTVSMFHSVQSNFRPRNDPDRQAFRTTGATVAYGKLLKWPDDFFTLSLSSSYQRYKLEDWSAFGAGSIGFTNGIANSVTGTFSLSRNSTSAPIYPQGGSEFNFSLQVTPPYSLINNKDYSELGPNDRFRWIEYHKWKFSAKWYTELAKKLVLAPSFETGIIGLYNQDVGYSPFEQFRVGGSGFGSWAIFGTEIIPTKGHDEGRISDPFRGEDADPVYSKFSLELRYPISLNPSATVYGYTYFEAANTWDQVREYNPFELSRAVGVGARMFLPMFGLLGFDYGWGLDVLNAQGRPTGQFLFSIGQQF